MRYKKEAAVSILSIVIIVSSFFVLNWNMSSHAPPQESPQPNQKTASDYAQSVLEMRLNSISIVKGNTTIEWMRTLQPFVQVNYTLLVDGQPFVLNSIPDPDVLIDRLDWNNFSVTINGKPAQIEQDKYWPQVFCPTSLELEMNVCARYRNEELSKHFTWTNIEYTMSQININVDRVSPIDKTDPYVAVQRIVDNYATVISGFIFMEDHISRIKTKFTSLENWYNWLSYSVHNANSSVDALNNFKWYANSSGVEDTINKLWVELRALAMASEEFKIIAEQHPEAVKRALLIVAEKGLNDPTQLLGFLNEFSSMSTGEALYSAIQHTIEVMQWTYAQVAVELFSWIANVTNSNSTEARLFPHLEVAYYANGSAWYMNYLSGVQGWTGYYSIGDFSLNQNHNPFPKIIEVDMQFDSVGDRGVAWWPADYCARYLPPDFSGNVPNAPFHASDFAITNVKCTGAVGGTYPVFLATESMVLDYLKENGFKVRCLPPTATEKVVFIQIWAVSKYVIPKVDFSTYVFVNDKTVLNELTVVSSVFSHETSPQSIYDSMAIVRKYKSASAYLQEINRNLLLLEP